MNRKPITRATKSLPRMKPPKLFTYAYNGERVWVEVLGKGVAVSIETAEYFVKSLRRAISIAKSCAKARRATGGDE